MTRFVNKRSISRRDVLRAAATWGGLTAVASFLEACGQVVRGTPTTSPTTPAVPTPTRQETPIPPSATPPEPTSTLRPSSSSTAPPGSPPDPTSTREPSPTATPGPTATEEADAVPVAFVKTQDRAKGVRRALALLGFDAVQGQRVVLKPNFNSADPAPGSTHNDVLRALVQELWERGAQSIAVADRSGMGDTQRVMEQKGVPALAQELGFETLVLDGLEAEAWEMVQPPGSHWQRGFLIARPFLEADAIVQTCCLKTHRFGGHFTMSLKNSVGMVAKHGPDGYNYMSELHASPHQRLMIAEINAAYTPALVVLDGVEAFVDAGPDAGQRVWSEVVLAATDRVAIDAVGVALLRHFGTTPAVSQGPIFEQEQIAQAVALGLARTARGHEWGADGPAMIRLVTDDAESAAYAAQIQEVLMQG